MSSYKGRIKRGAEVGGGVAFVWFLVLSAWGLLGGWQQLVQAVEDWPGFVRWLGQPQTPAILVGVAALVYLAALLWPEPEVDA